MKKLLLALFIITALSMTASAVLPDCIDNDGDGYGAYCAAGSDCNDNNSDIWMVQYCFIDADEDGYNRDYRYKCYADIGEFCYCGNGSTHRQCSLDYMPFTNDDPLGIDFCDDNALFHTESECGLTVPEFGTISGLIAIGGVGLIVLRKRKK